MKTRQQTPHRLFIVAVDLLSQGFILDRPHGGAVALEIHDPAVTLRDRVLEQLCHVDAL